MRYKEKNSDILFDVKLMEEDVVLVREVSTYPSEIYMMNLKDFVNLFDEYWGPQPD